jgi:predicted DNA-binding transcriptional regulator AlpA
VPEFDPFDPLLRSQRILQLTGVNATTLANWVREGRFPKPLILNAGSKRELAAWPLSAYEQWRVNLPQRMAKTSRLTPYERGPRPKKAKPVIGRPQ